MSDGNTLLSIPELAAWLNVSQGTVRNLIRDGMPHVRVGILYRFHRATVAEWLASRRTAEAGT